MRSGAVALLGIVLLAQTVASCASKSCTAVGCSNEAVLTIRSPTGTWADGEYLLMVTASGQTHVCGIQLPEASELACSPPLSARVAADMKCTEGGGCTAISGQRAFRISVPGTPPEVAVNLAHDGAELLNETRPLEYHLLTPNGPECGPGCRRATLDLAVK